MPGSIDSTLGSVVPQKASRIPRSFGINANLFECLMGDFRRQPSSARRMQLWLFRSRKKLPHSRVVLLHPNDWSFTSISLR
jgi:hypothetical protein